MSIERSKTCPQCKQPFSCYSSGCWCNTLPAIMPLEPSPGCLCKDCLTAVVADKVKEYTSNLTPEKRKTIAGLGQVDDPVEGIDYYINEQGFYVFTSWYHLRRGNCCGNGCLHCPYKKSKTL